MVCFLREIYLILSNCNLALRIIHKAGWVHRDLSPANLYLYIDPKTKVKRGIVGDLEYAKKAGTKASSDIRSVCISTLGYRLLLTLKIRVHPFLWLSKLWIKNTGLCNRRNPLSMTRLMESITTIFMIWSLYCGFLSGHCCHTENIQYGLTLNQNPSQYQGPGLTQIYLNITKRYREKENE